MSASNWATCPRCDKTRLPLLATMREKLDASYGTVPLAEFDKMRAQVEECERMTPPQTLREDYEVYGADDGTIVVAYENSCTKCGLHTKFTHRHEMDV